MTSSAFNTGKLNKPHFSASLLFQVLLILVWCKDTIFNYVTVVVRKLPYVNALADFVYPMLVILVIIMAAPYLLRKIKGQEILLYLGMVALVLLNIFIYPKNAPYIENDLWRIVGPSMLMLFLGVSYDHETSKEVLYWSSFASVLVALAYNIVYAGEVGKDMTDYNMNAAYNVLPSAMYVVYWAIEKGKFKYWLLTLFSFLAIFMYGTRGPVVCMLVFAASGALIKYSFTKPWKKSAVYVLAVCALVVILLVSNVLVALLETATEFFQSIGVSTRVFDLYLEGEYTTSDGRENLREVALKYISQNLLFGGGIMSDRVATMTDMGQAAYIHNFILEIFCHFGVVFGTVLLAVIVGLPLTAFYKNKAVDAKLFIVMITTMVFIKLMLSGSYIYEPYFYLLIGLSIGYIRKAKAIKNL